MDVESVQTILASPFSRWAAVAIALALVLFAARREVAWRPLAEQIAIAVGAYFAYFGVRGLTEASVDRAVANAWRIVDFERALGIFHEERLQAYIVGHQWMIDVNNWIYIYGHWPVIGLVAVWLLLRHPDQYLRYRNAFLISGGLGLLIFVSFPVAPPRLISLELVDTITRHSESYRVLQPPALVNQYAAMPSLHFGWNLLIGIALFSAQNILARALAVTLPILMAFATVLTANHFVVDLVAGAALALLGLYLSVNWPTIMGWWKSLTGSMYERAISAR